LGGGGKSVFVAITVDIDADVILILVELDIAELTITIRIKYIMVIGKGEIVEIAREVISYGNTVRLPTRTSAIVFKVIESPILSSTKLE